MKHLLRTLSVLAPLAFMAAPLVADESQFPKERPGAVAGRGGADRGGPDRSGPGRMAEFLSDPSRMAMMLLKQFDRDGDQKLDASELEKLLVGMRDRRMGEGMQRGGQEMRPGGFNRSGDAGRPDSDGQTRSGGVTPKRPPMENGSGTAGAKE